MITFIAGVVTGSVITLFGISITSAAKRGDEKIADM